MQANYHAVQETDQGKEIKEDNYQQEFEHKRHQAEVHQRNLIDILLSNVAHVDDADLLWLRNKKPLIRNDSKRSKRQTDSETEIEESGEITSDTLPMEEPAGVGLGFILGLFYFSD